MNRLIRFTTVFTAFAFVSLSKAQESKDAKPAASAAPSTKASPSKEELEAKFKALLTDAKLTGRWCGIKDGALTPEKEDTYSIVRADKLSGDYWQISTRLNQGGKEMIVPIPVKVEWAGSTPVIVVDYLPYPGHGEYSARVLFYENTYAGSWKGTDGSAGLLSGIIKKNTN